MLVVRKFASRTLADAFDLMSLSKPEHHDRSKINLGSARHAKSWAHALGVTKDELRCVIEKVGKIRRLW